MITASELTSITSAESLSRTKLLPFSSIKIRLLRLIAPAAVFLFGIAKETYQQLFIVSRDNKPVFRWLLIHLKAVL